MISYAIRSYSPWEQEFAKAKEGQISHTSADVDGFTACSDFRNNDWIGSAVADLAAYKKRRSLVKSKSKDRSFDGC